MNTRETSGMRELTASELEEVTGALTCAKGAHFKQAILTLSTTTSSGSSWGTDEAAGERE
jgi:hypothetical protein